MAAVIRKVPSLYGLIEVERDEDPPRMLNVGVIINGGYMVENFVNMSILPLELQQMIRNALFDRRSIDNRIDKKTKQELYEASKKKE